MFALSHHGTANLRSLLIVSVVRFSFRHDALRTDLAKLTLPVCFGSVDSDGAVTS